MALYDYRCTACGLEFEVSRPISQATAPAFCPVDGNESTRVFTAPMTLFKGDVRAPSPSGSAPTGWSHYGHRHAGGTGRHSHRGPR
jgi:putative FmdB family regulatory protein